MISHLNKKRDTLCNINTQDTIEHYTALMTSTSRIYFPCPLDTIIKWCHFVKWTYSFRKTGSGTIRKSGPYSKTHCMSQKLVFDKFECADYKYDNIF